MLICDKTTGTGENPTFLPFGDGGERAALVLALFVNNDARPLTSGDADAIEASARGYLERCGYEVGSAQFRHALNPGEDCQNARVGISLHVWREVEPDATE